MGNMDFNRRRLPTARRNGRRSGRQIPLPDRGHRAQGHRKTVTRSILQITHVITEGEYKGRKIFDRLNLWIAQNGQWVRRTDEAGNIAGQAMSELLAALGMATIRNHEELRGKSLVVKVKVRKSDEYGDSNDVQNYYLPRRKQHRLALLSRLQPRRLLRQRNQQRNLLPRLLVACRGERRQFLSGSEGDDIRVI